MGAGGSWRSRSKMVLRLRLLGVGICAPLSFKFKSLTRQ
jgi:hypothetical protein